MVEVRSRPGFQWEAERYFTKSPLHLITDFLLSKLLTASTSIGGG